MRPELREPPIDPERLTRAKALTRELYSLHEGGASTSARLEELGALVGASLTSFDLSGAFGSIPPDSFAYGLLLEGYSVPTDLERDELLELIRAICGAEGEEWQISYWLRCVKTATGCRGLTDVIFYPSTWMGDEHEPSPAEILDEALRQGRSQRAIIPPAPDGAA